MKKESFRQKIRRLFISKREKKFIKIPPFVQFLLTFSTYKSFQASVQEEKILAEPNGFSGSGETTVCRAEYQREENYSREQAHRDCP